MRGGTEGSQSRESIEISQNNLNDPVMKEREKIIKYNKLYIKKNKCIPPTSLEHYKFIKVFYQ